MCDLDADECIDDEEVSMFMDCDDNRLIQDLDTKILVLVKKENENFKNIKEVDICLMKQIVDPTDQFFVFKLTCSHSNIRNLYLKLEKTQKVKDILIELQKQQNLKSIHNYKIYRNIQIGERKMFEELNLEMYLK